MSQAAEEANPKVTVAVRGSSSRLLNAAALFAAGIATTAVLMGAGAGTSPEIGSVLGTMKAQRDAANVNAGDPGPDAQVGIDGAGASPRLPLQLNAASLDRDRLAVLSRPVPADTQAAAEMARALPMPKDLSMEPLTAAQTQVLAYGQFAPIAARVFSNASRQMETHWTLHPWDVARLADQASAEFFKEHRIRVEPRLIAGAYFAESAGVVQVGFDQRGVDQINQGKSTDEVARSGAKASFGLFQIDQQHAGAEDLDPLRAAKRAAGFLAEGQANLKRFPQLGMVAISATYNASTKLRTKIFEGSPLDDAEYDAYTRVRNHAASLSYGAAIYDIARRTYQAHLAEALKEGLPISVAAGTARRVDPLQGERVGAIQTLTGRTGPEAVALAPSAPMSMPPPARIDEPARAAPPPAAAPPATTPAPTVGLKPSTLVAALDAPKTTRQRSTAPERARSPSEARSTRGGAASPELDAAIRGSLQTQRPVFNAAASPRQVRVEPGVVVERGDRLSSQGRVQAGFQASVQDWKSSATSVLGRVAAFHEQRTREMAAQQRDLP